MIHRQDGKKWDLPDVLRFHDGSARLRGYRFYTVDYREPKAGEWYLGGAIISAYMAPNDLGTKFLVATPTHRAVKVEGWVKA